MPAARTCDEPETRATHPGVSGDTRRAAPVPLDGAERARLAPPSVTPRRPRGRVAARGSAHKGPYALALRGTGPAAVAAEVRVAGSPRARAPLNITPALCFLAPADGAPELAHPPAARDGNGGPSMRIRAAGDARRAGRHRRRRARLRAGGCRRPLYAEPRACWAALGASPGALSRGRLTAMLAPANPQTRVGVFDLGMPTRVGRPRRRRPGNRRVKPSARRRLASKPCFGANGEMQTKTDATGTTEFTYDSFGNLRNVTRPTGSAIDYVIDGMNRRIGRKVGGTLVQGLLYQNQLNAVAELDGAGNLVAQYVYGTKSNAPDVKTNGTGTYRIISDHLGSPRLIVNTADGTVVERIDFDEWGNVMADTSPGATPFGFAGGLYEASTGLVRFGARDYDSSTGRWVSKDPIRFSGSYINIYLYADADPINIRDLSGRDPDDGPIACAQAAPCGRQCCQQNCQRKVFDTTSPCDDLCSGLYPDNPDYIQQCHTACHAKDAALYQACVKQEGCAYNNLP